MIEKLSFQGWNNCYKLSNDQVALILTTDIGPRILSLTSQGGENLFHIHSGDLGQMGGEKWRLYGGHRLAFGPLAQPRAYLADNNSVQIEPQPFGARIFQYSHRPTGIQKEFEVRLDPKHAQVTIIHRLCNNGAWPVELAASAITAMAAGGVGIFPLPARLVHDPDIFHPPHALMIWDYSDMSDPRWRWGDRYVFLRGDQTNGKGDQRAGMEVAAGWCAYAVNRQLFVKRFTHLSGAAYPFGCSVALQAGSECFQLETLSPLTTLQPKEILEHTEEWQVYADVALPKTEAEVDQHILSKIL